MFAREVGVAFGVDDVEFIQSAGDVFDGGDAAFEVAFGFLEFAQVGVVAVFACDLDGGEGAIDLFELVAQGVERFVDAADLVGD